jgi:hypothetical protein
MQAARNDRIQHDLISNIPVNTLKSNRTPPPSIYENLVGKSVGLKRFNVPGSCLSNMMDVSPVGCVNSVAL